MSLNLYSKKRNFSETTEPEIKVIKSKNQKLIFVVHKHFASHLHWDFRIEINGALKSWAIPKEPPKTKGTKRLAISVEDHPFEYAKFQGIIPKGNYGAGKVEIWDEGYYELKSKSNKKIEMILHGKKLKGNYVLIKTSYGNKPEKSWLFFKI